jgi:hypothetical protein
VTSEFSDDLISFFSGKDFGFVLISFAFHTASELLGFVSQVVCVRPRSFSNPFCPAVQQREICALAVTHGNLLACCRTDLMFLRELQRILSGHSKSINVLVFF